MLSSPHFISGHQNSKCSYCTSHHRSADQRSITNVLHKQRSQPTNSYDCTSSDSNSFRESFPSKLSKMYTLVTRKARIRWQQKVWWEEFSLIHRRRTRASSTTNNAQPSSRNYSSSGFIKFRQSTTTTPTSSMSYGIQPYDQVPDDVRELVLEYCKRNQTPVSMQELMKTGRRQLEGKSYKKEAMSGSLNQHFASSKVLIQVGSKS